MTDESPQKHTASAGPERQLLTVVIEDYFQVAPLKSVVQTARWSRFERRVEVNTLKTLALLDEFDIRATFFVLGWIADEMPEVVREVARRGHEIACKGYYHRGIRQLGKEEFREDLLRSREALERAARRPVHGYRIAHSWFGPEDLWALDVLAEEGVAYDSSVRPFLRNFSHERWRRFEHTHRYGDHSLRELPLPSRSLFGWCLPIGGGNYFRQLPEALMKRAVKGWHRRHDSPFLMYFHVWELDPDQPRIGAAPLRERIRQYRNLDKMAGIVRHYLETYRFTGIGEYLGLDVSRDLGAEKAKSEQTFTLAPASEVAPAPNPVRSREPDDEERAVTVVVPCFNEELVLPYLAKSLESLQATLADYELHFILVDDGSFDGTAAALDELFGGWRNATIIRHADNRGVAAAILTGIRRADGEVVCSIDCDCTYDPHQLSTLIPMLRDGVDMVTASPYHPAGEVRNVRTWRLALSKTLSVLYGFVLRTKLATYTSCFRVYRREAVADLPVKEGGFLGVTEMLALLDLGGGSVAECPAVLEARLLGQSKMRTLRTGLGHLKLLVRVGLMRLTGGTARASAVDRSPTRTRET